MASQGDDFSWYSAAEKWAATAQADMPRHKVPISIRLDADIVEHFRAMGPGWQTRINALLRTFLNAQAAKTS